MFRCTRRSPASLTVSRWFAQNSQTYIGKGFLSIFFLTEMSQTSIHIGITWGSSEMQLRTQQVRGGASFSVSNKLPGDADTSSTWTTLWMAPEYATLWTSAIQKGCWLELHVSFYFIREWLLSSHPWILIITRFLRVFLFAFIFFLEWESPISSTLRLTLHSVAPEKVSVHTDCLFVIVLFK